MSTALLHRTEDGVGLAYWTFDGAARPEFLLVHGLASNARLWDGVATRLQMAGHRVVTLDLRGHGLSDKPGVGFDWATLTTDLAGLIEHVMDPPVVVAGQSFGGNLVLELATRLPHLVSSVVCVDGGFVDLRTTWPEWEEAKTLLTPPALDHLQPHDLAKLAEATYRGWPRAAIAGQLANFDVGQDGRVMRRLPLDSHLAILRTMWEQAPKEVARTVLQPVLVLAVVDGRHSDQVEPFVEALVQGRVIRLQGHHDLHAEQPGTVVGLIQAALADGFLR